MRPTTISITPESPLKFCKDLPTIVPDGALLLTRAWPDSAVTNKSPLATGPVTLQYTRPNNANTTTFYPFNPEFIK